MFPAFRKQNHTGFNKVFTSVLLCCFVGQSVLPGVVFAQTALNLPPVGSMVNTSEAFTPALIKGLKLDLTNPLKFNFIIDTGNSKLAGEELKQETTKLIRYFLSALTVPDDQLWVNLSPIEKDRIIADGLATTEMGRDMLAQDYILKQITASLVYPEGELGKKFWSKVRQKAMERFGTTDVPVDTFNKVWIVPQEAIVYEHEGAAYVIKNQLKVMLEEDYLALEQSGEASSVKSEAFHVTNDSKDVNALGSQIVREIVLPELEKEVNTGKNFAQLRQVANSVALAWWYKQNLRQSLLGKVYVDQNKVKGIDLAEKDAKLKIYNQYLEALKTGVYNYIKEDRDSVSNETVPRKYFSGGTEMDYAGKQTALRDPLPADVRPAVDAALTPTGITFEADTVLAENAKAPDAAQLAEPKGAGSVVVGVEIPTASREENLAQTGVAIAFGTSGWRGKNGGDFVLPNILRAAQGTASYVIESGKKKVIVGFDTREGNPTFSKETAALLAANGIQVIYINAAATPTPALALLAQQLAETDVDFGGVINFTASHSPAQDNGFKFSPSHGGAADKAITDRITVLANGATKYRTMDYDQAKAEGLIVEMEPGKVVETYKNYAVETLKATKDKQGVSAWDSIVNYFKSNPNKRIVLDPMQGTSVEYLRAIYTEIAQAVGREDMIVLINTNNGDSKFLDVNGRPQPDAKDSHKNLLNEITKNQGNALGISTDGDADRFGFIDFNGNFTSADDLIGLLAYFLKGDVGLEGAIGKTVVTSDFSNRVAEYLNTEIDELPVGFKWFVEQAAKNGRSYAVAGEESAHVMVGPFAKTWDDGIAVGLTVLWMVARSGSTLAEYKENVEKLLDVRYLTAVKTIRDDVRGEEMKKELGVKIKAVKDALGGRSFAELSPEEKTAVPFVALIESATGMKVEDIVLKDGAKFVMSGGSVAMRPSGTEPAVKVYVQAKQVLSQDAGGEVANRNKDLLESAGKGVLNAESVPAVPVVEATPIEEDGEVSPVALSMDMRIQPVGDFSAEKAGGAVVGDQLHTILDAASPSRGNFLAGGYEKSGYGVAEGAVNDGSHALGAEGNQGYYVDQTMMTDANGKARSGNDVFVGTTTSMAEFFKRRAERNGKPIRLVIKTGIGGQHTPFQGIASVFQAVDQTTGLIVGEYELGKDFEASMGQMLAGLVADWDQVAVIPSSKSGSTDETMTVFVEILKVLLNKVAQTNGMNGPRFAQSVMDYLHSINFANMKEVAGAELFRKFDLNALIEAARANDSDVTDEKVKRTFATVLGNMFFETTDRPKDSRLSAFVRNSGLDQVLGEDAPGFGAMFDNVGGRWTGDLHMMTFLAFYGLDAQAYWQARKNGIEQVRAGTHQGNQLGNLILDHGIKKIALVVPDELFWFGKASEQNFNESIWQNGFANLRAVRASVWQQQSRNYTDKSQALVINLTDKPIGPEFNVVNLTPVDMSNKQTLAVEMGRLFTTFYGMTYTVGTRLIERAIQEAGLNSRDVNISDLSNRATQVVQQNLFLRQPFVELGKGLLEGDFNALQAKQSEWIAGGRVGTSPIEQAVKDVVAAAARKEATTNIAGLQEAVAKITDMKTLAVALKTAALYARSQNRTFVPFIYLEGEKFAELRRNLEELGVEWVLQGTGDQHISYQQVLANPKSFLPFFISFVPKETDFAPASPAIGFVKGYLDNISPNLQRDYFARASYQALTVKREAEGGQGVFLRMLDTEEDRGLVRAAFTEAMNDNDVVKAFTAPANPGGIDLNPNLFNLQIKRDENGTPLPVYDQPIGDMKIDGFVPVIINIKPFDMTPILGGSVSASDVEPQKLSLNKS